MQNLSFAGCACSQNKFWHSSMYVESKPLIPRDSSLIFTAVKIAQKDSGVSPVKAKNGTSDTCASKVVF